MAKRKQTLLEQAAKARRLAASITDEEASTKLRALAEEYEALAKQDDPHEDPPDTMH